jgi:hypothetical protein
MQSSESTVTSPAQSRLLSLVPWILALGTSVIYYFSNPEPNAHFDYTWRMALALLSGHLGMTTAPPSWLNEMVPFGERYYSVFPLGAVLSVLPFALLKMINLVDEFPAALIASLLAGTTSLFCYLIAEKYEIDLSKKVMFALFPAFGSWMWANLAFAGAWQISLGFAVAGQAAALYFTLINRKPMLAGFCFAVAFGNRAEVIIVFPILVYLLLREEKLSLPALTKEWKSIAAFSAVPLLLGIATMAYNQARFGSPFDFGYSRIPVIQNEEWFRNGLFSWRAIPDNAWQMLFETWKRVEGYPHLIPKGFGGSILIASPFLFLAFTRDYRHRARKIAAGIAIGLLTAVLWTHASTGGWQFSYRYAMVLLPWILIALLEGTSRKTRPIELVLFVLSVAINAWGTYLFLWTKYVTP